MNNLSKTPALELRSCYFSPSSSSTSSLNSPPGELLRATRGPLGERQAEELLAVALVEVRRAAAAAAVREVAEAAGDAGLSRAHGLLIMERYVVIAATSSKHHDSHIVCRLQLNSCVATVWLCYSVVE